MTVNKPCFALFAVVAAVSVVRADPPEHHVVVAEGERFVPLGDDGWKLTPQQDSYASHTYGGMWMTHGACLGASADSEDSVAVQKIAVPVDGSYRVWSKYQAPPYFNYLHKIEVVQRGQTVFSHVYGRRGTNRLWSFSAASNELWWFWGVDHDAAEAPKTSVKLTAGAAEIRLVTVENPLPAGERFVDFVVLTTNPADDYSDRTPYRVATPFANEALAATELYMRFHNTTREPARLKVSRRGHFQPDYGGASVEVPDAPVAPRQWSPWINIGPFCRLVHNETLRMTLPQPAGFQVQFARDSGGRQLVGDLTVREDDVVVVPLEITWKPDARVRNSQDYAREVIALCRSKWRTANRGRKPREILFYGAFRGEQPWIAELKDALGYNTLLPDNYDHAAVDGYHQHAGNPKAIEKHAEKIPDRSKFRVLSFGDEISLGRIQYDDPEMQQRFRTWLARNRYTKDDLGVAPEKAQLVESGNSPPAWYSQLFNEEERFAHYRSLTAVARKQIGPQVLTGANFSPHHLALCYGPVYKWVDLFKHDGMSMFWAEDYIFSVPEVPQVISWMCAQMRCGVKYRRQPIHFYVMPHAPGQEPSYVRRNLLICIGNGVRHIDNFWVAPEENFTENYVAWGKLDSFRTLHEGIYDVAEAEPYRVGGTVRPARVAIVLSKATDFNESRFEVDPDKDPFLRQCRNAAESAGQLRQTICRKDQQMLYLALRHAQHAVELITEDDVVDGYLHRYDVVYFAGEWIDRRAVKELDAWVRRGGILYATAGIGHLDQFGRDEPQMMKLLGLKGCTTQKNLYIMRTLLELPLAEPVDVISLNGKRIPAIGMKQVLVPDGADVLGTWSDGTAAVTVHELEKGKAFAVGTLAGSSYMKTGLRRVPFARGGQKNLYNPVDCDPGAATLVRLGVDAKSVPRAILCNNPGVEAVVIDHRQRGTLVTLINWSNRPIKALQVYLKLPAAPKTVRSVQQQKDVAWSFGSGMVNFATDLDAADFFLLPSATKP